MIVCVHNFKINGLRKFNRYQLQILDVGENIAPQLIIFSGGKSSRFFELVEFVKLINKLSTYSYLSTR